MTKAKLYEPSNGTEGEQFESRWCGLCKNDVETDDCGGCDILLNAMIHETDDEEYPKEWCYSDNGMPQCTAFEPNDDGIDTTAMLFHDSFMAQLPELVESDVPIEDGVNKLIFDIINDLVFDGKFLSTPYNIQKADDLVRRVTALYGGVMASVRSYCETGVIQ